MGTKRFLHDTDLAANKIVATGTATALTVNPNAGGKPIEVQVAGVKVAEITANGVFMGSKEIEVPGKNKYVPIFGANGAQIGRIITALWDGAAWAAVSTGLVVGHGDAGANNTGDALTASGYGAARNNTGTSVTATGYVAAQNNTGTSVTASGYGAARNNTGTNVTATGASAAQNNTGTSVTATGVSAALNNTGTSVTATGVSAAQNNTGTSVTATGQGAALNNTGTSVTANGESAALNNTGNNVTATGMNAQRAVLDTVNAKTFLPAAVTPGAAGVGRITVTQHGLGAADTVVPVRITSTGTHPLGGYGTDAAVKVIDPNTITVVSTAMAAGTGTHTLTPMVKVDNVVAIGNDAVCSTPNTIQLGGNSLTFTRVGVGTGRLITRAELVAIANASADYNAFKAAIIALPA